MTDYIAFTVLNMNLSLNFREVSLDICNISDKTVTATVPGGSVFQWYYKGNLLPVSGSSYLADRSHFGEDARAGGDLKVVCRYMNSGCQAEQDIVVHVAPDLLVCPVTVQDGDGNVYPVVKVGCQCWMGQNLNIGTYEVANSDYCKFDEAGIQKWCYGNNEANCATYGGLYEWWEAVCGGKCDGSVTSGNAQSLNLSSESQLVSYGAKMVPGSTTQVQGICPDGWRMPGDGDWVVLEKYMGITNAGTAEAYYGTDQGSRMKMPGTFNGYDWCSGASCNSSGLGMLPGGRRVNSGGGFSYLGVQGGWWSSTPCSAYAWFRSLDYSKTTVWRSYGYVYRSYGFSVRCIRN